jgi:hypothetical protein
MKKILSYSLWGNNPKYTVGALKNAAMAPTVYPDWICRFYVDHTVPKDILYNLEENSNVEIIYKNTIGNWSSMFWRFEASYDKDVDIAIFRDTDSRLTLREKTAVDEWLKSDKTFHIMRDHPYHNFPILGGMWGVKNKNKYNLEEIIKKFYNEEASNRYGTDYDFFIKVLYPIVKEDSLVHDEFFEKKPFPSKRNGLEFIGQVFDENEKTVVEHVQVLRKYYE